MLAPIVLLMVLTASSIVGSAVTGDSRAGATSTGRGAAESAVAGRPHISPIRRCGTLTSARLSSTRVPVRILSAQSAEISGAEYCHVVGTIGAGFDFDLRLPRSTYQGDYVQEGCGGFCGILAPQVPLVSDDCPAVTGNTVALATDNEGHVATSVTDARWAANDTKGRVLFGSASEHQLSLVAKALIAEYYGRAPDYSYFDGCSDGGREALIEAQRYPDDFRGIVAGAPANLLVEQIGEQSTWNIRVNTGVRGREILTAAKLPALHRAVVRECGNGDGYVVDPRSCSFSPSSIECHGRVTDTCLTALQVRVATLLYRGPSDPAGQSLYPGGEPYGSELAWSDWFIRPSSDREWPRDTPGYQFASGLLRYMAYRSDPPDTFSLSQFHFTLAGYRRLTALAGVYDAADPDLSAFAADGGKLIIYQGWADEVIPPFGTVEYYNAVVGAAGGYQASQVFSRLYMIPAQYHCLAGGDPALAGADLLTPLMDWVQRGTAPETISFRLASRTSTRGGAPDADTLSVSPFDPLESPPSVSNGLNAYYNWVGSFAAGETG